VGEEIQELQRRGVKVIPGSVRRPDAVPHGSLDTFSGTEILCLQPLRVLTLLRAVGLVVRRWERIADLVKRLLLTGKESPERRLKALLHTWLGAYYALLLQKRGVNHIHVHHGYFGSWIAMVAARLLGVSFSLTLHGSDLLVKGAYLDAKLKNCRFCITISEYNRRYILEHFPWIDPAKIIVSRLGVDAMVPAESAEKACRSEHQTLTLLAVGRLHTVKDHAFLARACARLRDRGLDFKCVIAGEGPERRRLESLICKNCLEERLTLLGHVARSQMDSLYQRADVVVLTSRSEGIPLVLMEAMIRGRLVLAPAITGIPELVISGKTGFLYTPGAMEDFVERILLLEILMHSDESDTGNPLESIRRAAQEQVLHNFNRRKNLTHFGDRFLQLIATQDFTNQDWRPPHEDLVLQQI